MKRVNYSMARAKGAAENPFWISYSDLMTALVIVFMLMVASSLLEIHEKQEQREIIRREIVHELVNRLGKKYPVSVDVQTGSITISDGILFGFNETSLTSAGKEFLKNFVPEYTDILLGNPRSKEHIAQIIVEGHADSVGTYEINLDKSLGRAYTVSTYIFSNEVPEFPHREELKKLLTANGRSNMDPKETDELSRRVEFKFRLKDWDLLNTSVGKEMLGVGKKNEVKP